MAPLQTKDDLRGVDDLISDPPHFAEGQAQESLCTIRSALSNLDNEEKRISTIGHYAAYLAGGSEFDSQV